MKAVKRLVIAGGQYESNGVVKTRWINVGTLFKKDNGDYSILLNSGINFAAYTTHTNGQIDPNVWVNLFDLQPRNQQATSQQAPVQAEPEVEDVPF